MERFWPNIDNLAMEDTTPLVEIVAHYNDKVSCTIRGLRAHRTVPDEVKTPNDAWNYEPWTFGGLGTEPYLCEIWSDNSVGVKRPPSPSWQGEIPDEESD